MPNGNGKQPKFKKDEITCINLPKTLRDRLAERGKKTDTFADIVGRLLDKPCDGSNGQESDEDES